VRHNGKTLSRKVASGHDWLLLLAFAKEDRRVRIAHSFSYKTDLDNVAIETTSIFA
jgi:hypothetical protein